jgi:hypothetical protein
LLNFAIGKISTRSKMFRPLFKTPMNNTGDTLDCFLAAHAEHLRRNGSIVAKFRTRHGKRFGPYAMLTCRDAQGRQRAIYLGSEELVGKARTALAALRAPRRQAKVLARARQALRRGHRAARTWLAAELQQLGLHLQGSEVRGWSRIKPGIRVPESFPGITGQNANSGKSQIG